MHAAVYGINERPLSAVFAIIGVHIPRCTFVVSRAAYAHGNILGMFLLMGEELYMTCVGKGKEIESKTVYSQDQS